MATMRWECLDKFGQNKYDMKGSMKDYNIAVTKCGGGSKTFTMMGVKCL